MFKVRFKKNKPHPSYTDGEYPYEQPDSDPYFADQYDQVHGNLRNCETCILCNDAIAGSYLSVETRTGEHCLHLGCLASSFALLTNGFHLFVGLLFRKKRNNH